jgi:hypothetical protein
MTADVDSKFEKFLQREFTDALADVIIFVDKAGAYELFGKYTIYPLKSGNFKVRVLETEKTHMFSNVKNAVAWCTFDHVQKVHEANRIKDLDSRLSSIEVDIAVHQRMSSLANNINNKWIYINKYKEDILKKKMMVNELNSHINTSKMIQAYKFTKTKGPSFKQMR